ncbi:MAG: hypothetical protein LBJ59_03215 [Zoogloeaceae bacterium]|jgi:lambda repressor-like predicted transcriptional regulator|nr:hypothetical protein [Zoogloeaceae bacterium]
MNATEIKSALRAKGFTLTRMAKRLKVTRIQDAISTILECPASVIWPNQTRLRRDRRAA